MPIKLPTESRKSALRINPRYLLLYSAPKMGKTTTAGELKDNLVIDIEDGSDFADQGLFIKANSLKELHKIGEEIKEQGKPYKYITVDTISQLEVWAEEHATQTFKSKTIGKTFTGTSVLELDHGGGYFWWRQSYGLWFNYLCELAEHVIFLAHVKDKMLVNKVGQELRAHGVASQDLDLTGKLKAITCSKADAMGYLYRKVVAADKGKQIEELWVSFHGSEVMAGSRAKHLAGKEFKFDWNSIYLSETK